MIATKRRGVLLAITIPTIAANAAAPSPFIRSGLTQRSWNGSPLRRPGHARSASPRAVTELHRRGTKARAYEWSVAHYASRRANPSSPTALRGGAAPRTSKSSLRTQPHPTSASRTRALAARFARDRYDGVLRTHPCQASIPTPSPIRRRHHAFTTTKPSPASCARCRRAEGRRHLRNQGYRPRAYLLRRLDVHREALRHETAACAPERARRPRQHWILPTPSVPARQFIHPLRRRRGGRFDRSVIAIARMSGQSVVAYRCTVHRVPRRYFVEHQGRCGE